MPIGVPDPGEKMLLALGFGVSFMVVHQAILTVLRFLVLNLQQNKCKVGCKLVICKTYHLKETGFIHLFICVRVAIMTSSSQMYIYAYAILSPWQGSYMSS